jgi:acetolactate synthase-1/3 small subunit
MTTHTLSVLVENKPGVLAHVAGMFSRRAFNITSLSVGPTQDDRVSRMTIVVDGASTPVDQVRKQLEKLVRVLKVVELADKGAVERELALIKVTVRPELRAQLIEVATAYRAHVVDLGPGTLVLEAACSPGKLDALLALLDRHGTCELVRTGLIAIARGAQTITDDTPQSAPGATLISPVETGPEPAAAAC